MNEYTIEHVLKINSRKIMLEQKEKRHYEINEGNEERNIQKGFSEKEKK